MSATDEVNLEDLLYPKEDLPQATIAKDANSYLVDLEEVIKTVIIDGRTISEWYELFELELPATPTPGDLTIAASRCVSLMDKASRYLSIYQAGNSITKGINKVELRAASQEVVSEFANRHKAPPQNSLLLTLAEAKVQKDIQRDVASTVAVTLFKNILDKLRVTAELIKSSSFTLQKEVKLDNLR